MSLENNKKQKVVIIGSGIGGLGLSIMLAKKGFEVLILEKNEMIGGRARVFEKNGFIFDMGPSWYMMPDVFSDFFNKIGENIDDYLKLKKLSPSYRVFVDNEKPHDFFGDINLNTKIFEKIEKGSGEKLKKYIKSTGYQYKIAKEEFMYKNYDSIFDFLNKRVMTEGRKLPLFSSVSSIVNKIFKNKILRKTLQFQSVLLGTSPKDTPGIYSMMNYVDFGLGIWYPDGGIYKFIEALVSIAEKNGVIIDTSKNVEKIVIQNGITRGVVSNGEFINADIVVSNADMEFTDNRLLDKEYRLKNRSFWNKQKMAPSAFIMYIGLKKIAPSLSHHNLYFSSDWNKNFKQIFDKPEIPNDPAFYVCAPSKTDKKISPYGKENLFVLVPTPAGVGFSDEEKELYKNKILGMIENKMGVENIKKSIEVLEIFNIDNFIKDYNAFRGTALGPAHTLMQTAIFRPNNINKKVRNLFYVGAGTNPGIGMPICLISAELTYKRIMGIKDYKPIKKI